MGALFRQQGPDLELEVFFRRHLCRRHGGSGHDRSSGRRQDQQGQQRLWQASLHPSRQTQLNRKQSGQDPTARKFWIQPRRIDDLFWLRRILIFVT